MTKLAQVLSHKKVIDNRALNVAGVQPARAVLARFLYRMRRAPHDPITTQLSKTGLVVLEDFLPDDVLDATVSEGDTFVGENLPQLLHTYGTTTVRQFLLVDVERDRFPNLAKWRDGDRTLDMASAAERRPVRWATGGPLIEDITIGDYSLLDSQTRLHVDTVFNTHKIWLFLDDVTERNAPLIYVPGSHQLDPVRLRQEYLHTTKPPLCPDPSRQVFEAEVHERGLEPRVLACPRNTLVIANTCGYHARSIGEPGATRRALHMSFRHNPFWYPWPRTRRALGAVRRRIRPAST